MNDIGQRVVAALGEPAAREFLEVLERPDAERAELIGRFFARDDRARWLAELLIDLEDERGEITRFVLSMRSGESSPSKGPTCRTRAAREPPPTDND